MIELNKSYFGDCLQLIPQHIPDKSINLIKTDLPFGTTNCSWDSVVDLTALWVEYNRIIKDDGAILLNAQIPFSITLAASNMKMLRYEWIWEKTQATGFQNAKKMPMKAHENILVFYKHLPVFNPQKTIGHKPVNSYTKYIKTQNNTELYGRMNKEITGGGETDRFPRSVLVFPSDKQKTCLHPTQKPVALEEYLIKTYTNEGGIVLDSCAGSFTTAIACINTNRNYICMEKEQKYFNIGQQRIENHLRQMCSLAGLL